MKRVFITGGSGFVGKRLIKVLTARNITVHALARSDKSEQTVKKLGAATFRGDLLNKELLEKAMAGCDIVYHLAAVTFRKGGTNSAFYESNVIGTENVISAAKKARIKKLVFVSSDAVLLGDRPLINVDESWLVPDKHYSIYARTKAASEKKVLQANNQQFQTVIVRPRNIWSEDSEALQKIIDTAKKGLFFFINHGKYLTSISHVENVCEALILAAEKGRGGEVYFITDGKPIELRSFINNILKTKNIPPVKNSIPYWLAWQIVSIIEVIWVLFRFKNSPHFSRASLRLLGEEVTINDTKARRELGYVGKVTLEQGIRRFSDSK